MASPPHLILLGGFLGAGKTTAMRSLGDFLVDQGIRAALITNDQGAGLVDTELLRSCGHATEEVAGGCFCCRFDELLGAMRRFPTGFAPDAYIAEAVGSCTDLAATVTYPMRRLLGEAMTLAPLSVILDPLRARDLLGLTSDSHFSPNVAYIYRKQIEEADVVVINKCDIASPAELETLATAISDLSPAAEQYRLSFRTGEGVPAWMHRVVFGRLRQRSTMAVDYTRYADGEARLAWLNATLSFASPSPVDGNALLVSLAGALHERMRSARATVAHLKLTLAATSGPAQVAALNIVRDDVLPEFGAQLSEKISEARIIVNARAETEPDTLRAALAHAIEVVRRQLAPAALLLEHEEAFAPSPPVPTHRDVR